MTIDYKKTYYYIATLIAFFILFWGAIDLLSALSSFTINDLDKAKTPQQQKQPIDDYYQGKMTRERMSDSLVRVLVAGSVFIYCRKKIDTLEEKKHVSRRT
ncbi:hypothetical protein ACFL52_01100 [Candidatus Margulisiibacteriota bacterium]